MGFDKIWFIICVIVSLIFLSSMADGYHELDLLDDLFHSSANETLSKHSTGELYNISLPSNFSGVQLSAVKLRSGTFWTRGANYNCINIPPRVITMPYAKRIAIVYENLGNWSSSYFRLRNYSIVAPVVGFSVYDASNSSQLGNEDLIFNIMGDDPITVTFPDVVLGDKNVTAQCVKFGIRKTIRFTNMTQPNVCTTEGSGRFSIVIPSPPPEPTEEKKTWWIMVFVAIFGGLAVLILVGLVISKLARTKKMRKMESEADKGVAFDTTWIGRSKMPSASMVRTQPALEHDYVP